MTINIAYVCDRCKATYNTNDQFWKVAVVYASHSTYSYSSASGMTVAKQIDCCRKCAEALTLVPMTSGLKHLDPQPEPLTVEAMIRHIIREEICDSRNNP